jgi:stress-induced-phosphoprotein 1
MADAKALAEEAKKKGNEASAKGDHQTAIVHYTEALKHDPDNHILYSNRSAAYCTRGEYEKALEDAINTTTLQPSWGKGYSRLGAACHGLHQWDKAAEAYRTAVKLEPANDQYKKALADVEAAKAAPPEDPLAKTIGSLFNPSVMMPKIVADPGLRAYLSQPDYMRMLQEIGSNPSSFQKYSNDQRIMQTLSVLLGVGGEAAGRPPAADKPPTDAKPPTPPASNPDAAKADSKPAAAQKPVPMETETTPVSSEKQKALAEKDLGTAAYKRRDFDTALKHYSEAAKLQPEDMTYHLNIAAVYFEKGQYAECIEACNQAIEIGRAHRADYTLIAKAFMRIGNAHAKQQNWKDAITYYNKSLTEHRTADCLEALQKAEKEWKLKQEKDYQDPVLGEEAKQKGNEAFKKHDYPEAVKHYTEAVKRNPADHISWSNRAAAYTKLMAYSDALKDCEECLKLKPDFVKGYIRKGFTYFAMKEYQKALDTYEKGLLLDPNNEELQNNMAQVMAKVQEGDPEAQRRGMADPDIQAMLQDPVMMAAVKHMQEDPSSMRDYLKDPKLAANLQKLINAGVIRTGSRPKGSKA